ncbi:unnamed protein product [Spirodela intermedia]|uniref:BED-type domain-containing protein n=1 Tax=Spirodela intermedia TaxID=51605 RepID=A0A7I8J765_SPIIN|nr:unnamed protein product [Spirodela intermedia]CAA6665904.1 unnamed protein product [Spirodela intermedia]
MPPPQWIPCSSPFAADVSIVSQQNPFRPLRYPRAVDRSDSMLVCLHSHSVVSMPNIFLTRGSSMVREKDLCWEYCEKLEGNKVRCNFCQKILNGGISRLKHHLSRVPSKGVNPCSKVRDEVSERVKTIIQSKEEGKEAANVKRQRLAEGARSPSCNPLSTTAPSPPASAAPPPARFFPSHATTSGPQPAAMDVERCVAQFFFENRLDFGVAHSASYQQMMEALGGAGFRGPSAEALKTTWLETLKSEVNAKIKEIENEWATTGCTIIADTWTDNKSRAWINFFISSPSGTFFHRSVDASPYFKNAKHVSDLFDSVILGVGSENVVQVIVDDALSYMSVGNYIMQKYGSIFWSPCASRCLGLILEDFCKIDWVSRCILQAQSVTKFIYNNAWVLALMRKFTGGRTSSGRAPRDLRSSICSILRNTRRPRTPATPRTACVDVLDDSQFWRAAEELAAVSEALLKVLREVSGGKPAVGSIYESMTRAKESIRTYYIMDEAKCKTFLDIVDKRWQHQLHSPIHAAAAYLNPSIQYNPEVKFLGSIKEEFLAVLDKLLPTPDLRQDITTQIFRFRKAQGMFGSNLAREARSTAFPGSLPLSPPSPAPSLRDPHRASP